MKLDNLTPGQKSTKQAKPLVEKKKPIPSSDSNESISIYGMDPSSNEYADMAEEMRVLKRADPDLYRRIQNLD